MKNNRNTLNKTKVFVIAIIAVGIIALVYILMGEERPEMDYNSNSHNFHMERNK